MKRWEVSTAVALGLIGAFLVTFRLAAKSPLGTVLDAALSGWYLGVGLLALEVALVRRHVPMARPLGWIATTWVSLVIGSILVWAAWLVVPRGP